MDKNAIVVNQVYKKFSKPKAAFTWLIELFKKNTKDDASLNGNGAKEPKEDRKAPTVAVDRVSFTVKEGEIFGVLGPNGSGKSTLIRLMATLLLPDDGSITIMGHDPVKDPITVQQLINRVSVEASFFKKLSPMENLIYGARLYGMNGKEIRKRVVDILTRLGLEKRNIFNPMEEMSRGMQQKVAIARALLSRPRVLLLDEPTTGLDPVSKREVQAVVRELQEQDNTTILLTTHDMNEAEILCDRVAILHKGKLIALDTPEALKQLAPRSNGHLPSLEDVFIHLTGDKLKEEQKEDLEAAQALVKAFAKENEAKEKTTAPAPELN
ncbi:MAG TPA: ABC transporter ATP-binding protein [Anaerolineales bacterium]|nr:ABC transporter ATP-binding protein [Anaerolineales bacterium]